MRGQAYEQKRQNRLAVADQRRAIKNFPGKSPLLLASLARALALSGERKKASRLLKELEKHGAHRFLPAYYVGVAHAALGENNAAFRYFRQACNAQEQWVTFLKIDPKMDDLRPDRRYRNLLFLTGLKD